jgi:hypothetical protein
MNSLVKSRGLAGAVPSVDCGRSNLEGGGVRARGLFAVVLMLAGGALPAAGCSASGGPGNVAWAQPSGSVSASATPSPSTSRPPSGPTPPGKRSPGPGRRSPAPTRPGGAGNGWPPNCRLADLRFSTASSTGAGQLVSGSVLLTNVSGRRCIVGTFLILRWRDARGAVLPVKVTHVRGPVPPSVPFVIQPGSTALAGLYWHRYTSLNSTTTCPPYPKTLDVWLPPTVEVPHPERGPAAHTSWMTGDNASVCGGAVELQPIDRHP